jgi:hypothetical protein
MPTSPYTAKINGSLVNVIGGSLNVQNEIGQRSTGGIKVWSALGVSYSYGTQVQVYNETAALVYSGYVNKDKATKSGAQQGKGYLEHDITLMDNAYRADKRVAFKSYLNQTCGYIVNDLLGAYLASEGVTSTPSSIASGPTIPEVIWNGKQISEALTWLAKQAGYWWQIDANGVLWFQPYGGVPAPFVLDGTQVSATKNLSCEYGNDQYVNTQYAKGSYAEKGSKTAQLHETFKGDGNKRGFTLSYPVNTLYQVKINGVDVTAQTLSKGDTGGQWYYARGDAVIAQDTGQTILTSSDTLDVFYTGRFPVLAVAKNPTLITTQQGREGGSSTGIIEAVYTNTKVHSLAAAFQIASALLSHYGQDMTVLEFDTRTKGLAPGQMLTVNLSDFGLANKQMLISAVAISDQDDGFNIWFHVTCVGSPVESAQWQTYWQALMNQQIDPSELSDTTETFLALLLASTIIQAHTLTVTKSQYTCPICGNATICGNSTIIC